MIAMTLELAIEQRVELESLHKSAVRLYAGSEKKSIDVRLGKTVISVPVALVSIGELEPIFLGEKYAGTMSGMFFITKETPEKYLRFAAFHELAEHAAPRGFDVTGLAKHFQAIAVELGYAQATLSKAEYEEYFAWRKSVERTDFFKLKDEGLIRRITENIEKIFASMPQFLIYGRKKLAELIEDKQIKQSEENKMSLIEKLTKHYQEHQEALAKCEEEYTANQVRTVLAEYDRVSKALTERAKPFAGNAKELKVALDKLQDTYNSGNDIVKSALEDQIKKIRKDYEKQAAAEEQLNAPLNIELLWNSSNGDKELIIPIKWASRLNKDSPKEHSLAEKLYEATAKTLLGYDVDCTEEEWCGYTRIISSDVAGKSAEGLAPKEFVISLSSQTLTEQIFKEISKELQDANITLNIVNSQIKAVPGKDYRTKTEYTVQNKEAEPKKEEEKSPITQEELSDICHQLATVEDAAKLLGIDGGSISYKISVSQIHGFQCGPRRAYAIPVHDLITYLASHSRTGSTEKKANKFEKARELTAEEFAKYRADVGDVLTVKEAREFLDIGQSTVSMWLNNGRMHGVKHNSMWYVPKIELELCKKLYLSK